MILDELINWLAFLACIIVNGRAVYFIFNDLQKEVKEILAKRKDHYEDK